MKKVIKYSLLTFSSIILLFIIFMILLQSGALNGVIKKIIISSAEKSLQGEIQIERITGNPLKKYEINNISLAANSDTLLTISMVSYELSLSKIFRKQFQIDLLLIDTLQIYLEQYPDLNWNFSNLIVPTNKEEKETVKEKSEWDFILDNFALRNSGIRIISQNNSFDIPEKIENINFSSSQKIIDGNLNFELKNLTFDTKEPTNSISEFHFQINQNNEHLRISDLILKTEKSEIVLNAEANLSKPISGNILLNVQPLDVSEIRNFLPHLTIFGTPEIMIDAKFNAEKIESKITIEEDYQNLFLSADVNSYTENPNYEIKAEMQNIDLSKWINNTEFQTDLNGTLNLIGKGKEPENIDAKLDFSISNSEITGREIFQLDLEMDKKNKNIELRFTTNSNFGEVRIGGFLNDIFTIPKFDLNCAIRNLDIAPIMLKEELKEELNSKINLDLRIVGNGKSKEKLIANMELSAFDSHFNNFPLDSLLAEISYNKGEYEIKELLLKNSLAEFAAFGAGSLDSDNDINIVLKPDDLTILKDLLKLDELKMMGIISGDIDGKIDSLNARFDLDLSQIQFNDFIVGSLQSSATMVTEKTDFSGRISSHIENFQTGNMEIKSLILNAGLSKEKIDSEIKVTFSDSLELDIHSIFFNDEEEQKIQFPRFDFRTKTENWNGGSDSMKVILVENRFDIRNFAISSEDQSLKADGMIDLNRESDFFISIDNFSISKFSEFSPFPISGRISSDIELKGTSENPEFSAELTLENGVIDKFDFYEFQLESKYEKNNFSLDFDLLQTEERSFSGSLVYPIKLSLRNTEKLKIGDEIFSAQLRSNGIDLSFLQNFVPLISVFKGNLYSDLKIENTLNSPQIFGNIQIKNGRLIVPDFGINYEYEYEMSALKNKIVLEKFNLQSEKGKLSTTGNIQFEDNIRSGIREFALQLKCNDFYAARNKNLQVLLNTDIKLEGTPAKPEFDGKLKILRAMINIDTFNKKNRARNINKPLLIRAISDTLPKQISNKNESIAINNNDLIKQSRGKFTVEIPRNTWIRSKDMNIEITGDVQLLKNSDDLQFYGKIEILRGKYTLYGRRFDLKDGSVTFTGGSQFNAILDLKLAYVLRDADHEKRILVIMVNGDLKAPLISFKLDNNSIEEKDAVSYLLFGRSSDAIDLHKRSEMNEKTNNMGTVTNILAAQLSGQLSKTIGKVLNLDVIEFDGSENWQQASFTVGKYLTNDLFISYQKEFNIGSTKEPVSENVTLEYEFTKSIGVQLSKGDDHSTGLDLILKLKK